MKKFFLLVGVTFLSVFTIACSRTGTPPADAAAQTASRSSVRATVMNLGSTFKISLPANPTTGFDWSATYDKKIVSLLNQDYKPKTVPKGTMGAGGTDIFNFKTLTTGTTIITFEYRRPWEKTQPPSETRKFAIEIR